MEGGHPLLEPPGSTTKRSRLHRWGLGPLPSEHLRHPETWRHTIFLVVGISGSTVSWWAGTIFQSAILVLIIANVGLVIVDTEPYFNTSAGTPFNKFYIQFEIVSVIIFTIEYLLRVWCCVESPGHISRLRWAMTPLAIVDVVSLVPFYTDLLTPHDNHFRGATMIRTLRTFSLLRMERTFKGFRRIADVLQHKGEELFITAFIAMIMLILSSSIMYYVENPGTSADDRNSEPPPILYVMPILAIHASDSIPRPRHAPAHPRYADGLGPTPHGTKFTSISTAMWWSVAAFTTTGYGDMVPTTAVGRFLGGLLAILGVGFFALPAGILGSGFVEIMLQEKRARQERQSGACGAAGATSRTGALNGGRTPSPLERANTVTGLLYVGGDGHTCNGAGGSILPHLPSPPRVRQRAAAEGSEAEVLTLQHIIRALQQEQPTMARSLAEERLQCISASGWTGHGERQVE